MDILGNRNLRRFWDELAAAHADKVCLMAEYEDGNTETATYGELNQDINRVANVLIAHGIQKGEKVILQMTNTPWFLKVWFALSKIGAVMVSVNNGYIAREFDHLVKTSEAVHCICDVRFWKSWEGYEKNREDKFRNMFVVAPNGEGSPEDCKGAIDLEALTKEASPVLSEVRPIDPEDLAEILFTSGTTSAPKGVMITHANLVWAGFFTSCQARMNASDRLLTTMPNFHVDFQCNAAMPIFTVAGTLVMIQRFSAHRFWRQICLYRATITQAVPMILRTVMRQPVHAWEKDHVLREILYGLPMAVSEYRAFKARFGVDVINSYGMTETLVGNVTLLPEDDRRFPCVGRPYFGYEARLVDENGNDVKPGEIGTFMIRGIPGRTLFKGYINNEKATRETLVGDGWMLTKDKGRIDEDGFFWFVDRSIHMIKRSGENISSTEIENVLTEHPKIAEAAVIGVPDPIRDQEVKAFVRLKEGVTMTKAEVLAHCRNNLAEFKWPVFIEFREEFVRTCTGKIVKEVLSREPHDGTERLN